MGGPSYIFFMFSGLPLPNISESDTTNPVSHAPATEKAKQTKKKKQKTNKKNEVCATTAFEFTN